MDVNTGERLRLSRERAKLSQGQVAHYEGKSKGYISDLERGRNDPNAWDLIARLARRYHTTTDYLLGLTDDPNPPAGVAPATNHVGEARGEYATKLEIVHLYETLEAGQQEALVAVARSLVDAQERSRRSLLRSLVDRLFDDIAARVGEEEAETLMAAIDAADRAGDPAALAAWLQRNITAEQQPPD